MNNQISKRRFSNRPQIPKNLSYLQVYLKTRMYVTKSQAT
jgi:hypothetical protein